MAEPLTIVGGIAAILEISSTVVDLVKTVKDASTDRQKLLAEIHATTALCQTLKDYAEMDAVPWTKTFQTLRSSNNGPIEQFQASLGCLQKKLAPGDKETSDGQVINAHAPVVRKMNLKSWGRSLKWPFTKDEVREILADIERQKSLFSIALTNDTLRLTAAISKGITHIITGVDAIQENQQSEQRKQALANLSTIDFEAVHYDVSSRRASGTGQWLLKSTEFETWLNSSSNVILWCRGIPGAGKTIMSSLIIDHLRAINEPDPSTAVAGIYCTYRDPQTTANMLGSVSQQLAAGLDTLPRVLFKDQSLSSKIISEVLSEMMLSYQKIFFVIDALDECLSKLDLLKEIHKLLETGSTVTIHIELLALTRRNLSEDNIHILVTSRSGITDIERNLKADGSLEVRSNENDVRLYLQQSLRDTDYLSEWISANPKLELSIIEAILPRLAGMFLLARLYVDFLAQIPTQRGVRKALGSLPEGIDDTYADAWERVCAQKPVQADLGKKVISWVTCATRPLRVTELRHALAIEEGDSELDAEGLLDINSLTSFCAGLVVIDAQNNRLSLVHPTANEYFVERQRDLLPTAHDLIATACTTYLLMNVFRGACLEPDDFNRRYGQNKLLGYAAVNWGSHVRSSNSKTSLDLARRLLQNDEARGAAVQALVLNTLGASERFPEWPLLSSAETKRVSDFYRYDFEDSTRPIEAIHLTAFYGLTELTDNLIETKHSIDERDGMGATAVHWAILGGQSAMLDHLLQRGANVQVHRQPYHLRRWSTSCCNVGPNPDLTYPLHMAAALGDTVAIELLISHDADIHRLSKPLSDRIIYGSSYITALTVALENNQDLAAELLRARGANVNDDHWLFFYTAQHGSSDALRTLIASGADRRNLEEAFRGAIYMCRYDMLVMLLDAGVDVNDKSAIGFTAREDSETSLEKEEPIQDSQGILSGEDSMRRPRECTEGNPRDDIPEKTPLIIVVAAGYGKEAMKCVALLLRSGADTNRIGTRHYEYADDWTWSSFNDKISKSMPSGRKTSAVHTAAYYRNLDMVQFLVDNGANVNLIIHDRYTALTSALHSEGYDCEVRFISLGLEGAPNKIAELTRFREEVLEEGFRFQLKQLLFASERL